MGFDVKKFGKAKFEPRTEIVAVTSPALTAFFSDGDRPEFTVRAITGEEMARVNDATSKQKNLAAVVEALAGQAQAEKVSALRESLGLSDDDLPADLARRIEMLRLGCVSPELDLQTAAKIFRVAHVDGYNLSNKILVLSGQGLLVGEPKASGAKKTSDSPSQSETPEGKCSTS